MAVNVACQASHPHDFESELPTGGLVAIQLVRFPLSVCYPIPAKRNDDRPTRHDS